MLKFLFLLFNFYTILSFGLSADSEVNENLQNNFKLLNQNFALKFYESINEINNLNYFKKSVLSSDDELKCLNQLNKVWESFKNGEMWSIEVIDSWGKIPTGILRGHMREYGNFEECLNVQVNLNDNEKFKGQYCTLNLPVKKLQEGLEENKTRSANAGPLLDKLFLQLGICVPNVCDGKMLDKYFKDSFKEIGITLGNDTQLVVNENCRKSDPYPRNAMFYVAIVLLVCFAVVMLLSTLYDYKLSINKEQPSSILFIAFSIKTNGKKLFRIEDYSNKSNNVIECLNGIRCLSIIMVLYGHQYGFSFVLNFINAIDSRDWEKTVFSFIIKNGTLAVDSFFVLSGCLLIWSAFKEMDKSHGRLNIPLMYFHRYIRLTPVVAIAIIISIGLFPHLGNGPIWDLSLYIPSCEKYWWTTLLYVQNYVNPDNMCLPHTWYLAVDTHFYILSPLLIIPMYKWGIRGIIPGVLAAIGSIVYVFITWMNKNYHWFLQEKTEIDIDREKLIYTSTHSRFPSYIVGIALGYLLFKLRNINVQINKGYALLLWLSSLIVMAGILFGLYPRAQNLPNRSSITTVEGALFESLSRVAWSIALACIIFLCHKGYGGVINTFLSWGIWQPLARLSYSIYILHALVQMLIIQTTKTDVHFSDFDMMIAFWATFGFTLLLSVIFVLAFELPILGIEKAIFSRNEKKNIV